MKRVSLITGGCGWALGYDPATSVVSKEPLMELDRTTWSGRPASRNCGRVILTIATPVPVSLGLGTKWGAKIE